MLTIARSSRVSLLLLLLVGPIAGGWAWYASRADQREVRHARFGRHVERQAARIAGQIGSSVEMLQYLAALYHGSASVARQEFTAVAQPALARHPDIHAVAWAPRVEAREREVHVARMRAQGLVAYEITHLGSDRQLATAPLAAEHYPVSYVQPLEGNEASLGFDLASESSRRTALAQAISTGRPHLTDPVRLVQDTGPSEALLVVLPVFAPAGGEAGRTLGVVLLVWRVDDLLATVLRGNADGTLQDVRIDLQQARGATTWRRLVSAAERQQAPPPTVAHASATLNVAGRAMRLTAAPGRAFPFDVQRGRPLLLGLLAWLSAGLVALGVWFWAWRVRIAQERGNLRLTRSLLRSLDQGVVVADGSGEIQLVNEAAERMVGGLADTGARRGWAASGVGCLVGDPASPEAPGTLPMARAVAGEHFEDEEFFVRRASAAEGLWLLVSGAPLRSARGEALGGVVVFRDITQRKAQDGNVNRLTAAVDQSADVIFVTDREGRILYVNRGFEEVTGFSREDAVGKTPRILNSGAHGAEHFRAMWGTILRGDVYRGMTANRREDGTIWHGEQSVTPIKDTQGQVTHFVSVTKDMSERRLLHEREAEMRVAGNIQQRLYPMDMPHVAGVDVAGAVFPADVTCGDYFDVISLPDGALAFVIGDVSGHGIGPALIMVETRAHLRSLLGAGQSIEDALVLLNELLCEDIPDDRFVSLLLVRFEPATRHLTHVNAGHPPGIVLAAGGASRADLGRTGPALGMLPGAKYIRGETLELDEGDLIALFTDGITEVRAPDGTLFESERVLQAVRGHRAETSRNIVEGLYASASTFAAGRKMDDDVTLLVCKIVAAEGSATVVPTSPADADRAP